MENQIVVVVGGGGHAKVVMSVSKKAGWNIFGYTDIADRGLLLGVSWIGDDKALANIFASGQTRTAVVGVGKIDASSLRLSLADSLVRTGFDLPVIVSPGAIVNEEVVLGAGTVVCDGAVVNSGAVLGRLGILNTNATVEHDCVIGENVHIAPGAVLSGGVTVGANCMIGVGAIVRQGVRISTGCLVGAGAVVVSDLDVAGIYVGAPARRIDGGEAGRA